MEALRRSLLFFPDAPKPRTKKTLIDVTTKVDVDEVTSVYRKYFGKRLGVDINLKPDVNYTREAIENSLTAYQANRVADIVVNASPLETFRVIELRPLVGTTTLALMDRSNVESMRVSEAAFRTQLENNLIAYNKNRKLVIIVDRIEKFSDGLFYGQVAIIHPDPESLVTSRDLQTVTSQGIKIENLLKTMLPIFSLVVVVGPKEMFPIDAPGYKVSSQKLDDMDKMRAMIFESEVGKSEARKRGQRMKVNEAISKEQWQGNLRAFLEKLLPKIGPPPTVPGGKKMSEAQRKKALVPILEKQKRDIEKMLEPDAMEIWYRVFTHSSIKGEPNYESLESLGDSVLKGLFGIYMFQRIEDLQPDQMTNLNQWFQSVHGQPEYTRDLDLSNRSHYRINVESQHKFEKSEEDLFEAFVGGYFTVAEKKLGKGYGYLRIMQLLTYIYRDKKKYNFERIIEENLNQPRTQVKQRLDKIFVREYSVPYKRGSNITVDIYVDNSNAIGLLQEYGVRIPINLKIGSATQPGMNQEAATKEAYINALQQLDIMGFTETRANEIQEELRGIAPSVADMRDAILQAKAERNIDALYFLVSDLNCATRLFGVRKDKKKGKGGRHILLAELGACGLNINQAKRRTMEDWLRS